MEQRIAWREYPVKRAGCYAHFDGMTLTAQHNGAWCIFDNSTPNPRMKGSVDLAPERYRNIEAAKAAAEKEAITMKSAKQ